jgi:methionyl-tRNA formyltransferase
MVADTVEEKEQFSVLVLCGGAPRHLYVANRLSASANVVGIVLEVGGKGPGLKKIFNVLMRPQVLLRKVRRALLDRSLASGDREREFFFNGEDARLIRDDLALRVANINDPEVLELVEMHKPDVIAVFGTSLIRGALLGSAKLAMINLHGGLSPYYRGADCTFWALYNREPEQIGCTLHYIDPGIDTGMLIAHIRPEVVADDRENSLFWRGVKASADVYCKLLERLQNGESFGQQQKAKGRLYQVKDRTRTQQKIVEQSLDAGLLDGYQLPLRVTWFNLDSAVRSTHLTQPIDSPSKTGEDLITN